MSTPSCPSANRLLAAFPAEDRARLRKYFTCVTLKQGEQLRDAA